MEKYCIICREESDNFSDEHVIPDALGGYYHIYTVCKECNSDLGSSVDAKLVNHQFAEFQRYLLGLTGKSKKLPNPFSGTHHIAEDVNKKIQLRLGEDGKPTPYTITNVSYEELETEGGGTKVSICIDASDEKKLDSILEKIAKKLQVPIEQLEGIDRSVQTVEKPNIKCSLSIDLADFKIGLLKIAYEFSVDTVDGYFSDPSAIEISEILKNAKYDSVEKFVSIGSGFDHQIFDGLRDYLDFESKKHYLIIVGSQDHGLVCLVHLHGMFSVGVRLSNLPYPDSLAVIGVNDIEKKSFRKIHPEQLLQEVFAPPELRFQYYFPTEHAAQEFLDLQTSEEFGFHTTEAGHPVFDSQGNPLDSDLYSKMKESEHLVTSEALEGGGIAHTFPIQDELFIKILPTGKLVQVIAVREELRQIAKL
ncbi:HNH endonuclease [Amphritea atlantica]|uniref:HNH endonuclease n=2 Tax=Amphritea atlantica TaxID=355243 RepID=A0A1H9CMZ1_9GAMM|nr:HNH endonuclease [Amphritea atlantica]